MDAFSIPVAVFMFKRGEKTAKIIEQISKVRPKTLYLIGDGPRTENELQSVLDCRKKVEEQVFWDCNLIKNYSDTNRGVYNNIVGGAQWVFSREKEAIFLEDDNLPDLSFFYYCQELLQRYREDSRVLWICGTNYLGQYNTEDGSDYCFTKLMLPCGWASWSDKFGRFYDGTISLYRDPIYRERIKMTYTNKLLYKHDVPAWDRIISAIDNGRTPSSWDYQMAFSLRANNVFGIAPKNNLIRNIGVDMDSTHGGTSMSNIMTRRFCEIPTFSLTFPLKHPKAVLIDPCFECLTEKIIILPFKYRLRGFIVKLIKKVLRIDQSRRLFKR